MKILKVIFLVVFPILLVLNLVGFLVLNVDEFRGMSYFFDRLQNSPGFEPTLFTINFIAEKVTVLKEGFKGNLFNTIGDIGELLFAMFSLPVVIVGNVIADIIWFVGTFLGYDLNWSSGFDFNIS